MKDDGEFILNSTVAHICARSEGGPRWDPHMTEEENRSPLNLIPMCQKHSTEIDIKPWTPVEKLREWKTAQIADFQKRQKSWSLTDEEVEEVVQISFTVEELGTSFATANSIMALSRAVGVLAETAQIQRDLPKAAATAWMQMRSRVQQSFRDAWDPLTGKRIRVEPSEMDTLRYRQNLDSTLEEAKEALQPKITSLIGEIHAVSHAMPELASWCDWIEVAARKVLAASSQWPGLPPVEDDGLLQNAINELLRASSGLSAKWQDKEAEEPPVNQLPPYKPIAMDVHVTINEHEALLEEARPWSRVDDLPYEPATYQQLIEATQLAINLPFVSTFLPLELSETARLAARVARNTSDEIFERLINEAVALKPLAIACHLLRQLMFVAQDKQRTGLRGRAEEELVQLLQTADWTDPQVWLDNRFHVRLLMGWTAFTTSDAKIRSQITDALVTEPRLLEPVVLAISTQGEKHDNADRRLIGIYTHIRDVPGWFPTDRIASEIRRQYPNMLPADEQCDLEDANEFSILAARLLYLDTYS